MTTKSKEWLQYATAVLIVLSGIALTFICFFIKEEVTEGVLWYVAQALTFAGAVFGINIYFHSKIGESESRIKMYLDQQLQEKTTEHSTLNPKPSTLNPQP